LRFAAYKNKNYKKAAKGPGERLFRDEMSLMHVRSDRIAFEMKSGQGSALKDQ